MSNRQRQYQSNKNAGAIKGQQKLKFVRGFYRDFEGELDVLDLGKNRVTSVEYAKIVATNGNSTGRVRVTIAFANGTGLQDIIKTDEVHEFKHVLTRAWREQRHRFPDAKWPAPQQFLTEITEPAPAKVVEFKPKRPYKEYVDKEDVIDREIANFVSSPSVKVPNSKRAEFSRGIKELYAKIKTPKNVEAVPLPKKARVTYATRDSDEEFAGTNILGYLRIQFAGHLDGQMSMMQLKSIDKSAYKAVQNFRQNKELPSDIKILSKSQVLDKELSELGSNKKAIRNLDRLAKAARSRLNRPRPG